MTTKHTRAYPIHLSEKEIECLATALCVFFEICLKHEVKLDHETADTLILTLKKIQKCWKESEPVIMLKE